MNGVWTLTTVCMGEPSPKALAFSGYPKAVHLKFPNAANASGVVATS